LWLAGLFTVTALIAVFWLGPDKYIVAGPAAGRAAATRQCSDPAGVGYAIELAFPLINLNSSSAAQCDVPASGAAAGVVVFGWVVRAAAAALLALYTLGLTGVTRRPPGSG
jgi:hypothetical protein